MTEQYPINHDAISADRLTEACFDLSAAMRKQYQRSVSHDRAKARLVLERHGILTGTTADQQRQIIDEKIAKPDEMRTRLRRNFMVPLGTRITGQGHSLVHYWSIYESDESANQKQPPTMHLVADEITREAVMGVSESNRLYDIFINCGEPYVFHNGRLLQPEEFTEPYAVIQAARELYP